MSYDKPEEALGPFRLNLLMEQKPRGGKYSKSHSPGAVLVRNRGSFLPIAASSMISVRCRIHRVCLTASTPLNFCLFCRGGQDIPYSGVWVYGIPHSARLYFLNAGCIIHISKPLWDCTFFPHPLLALVSARWAVHYKVLSSEATGNCDVLAKGSSW